MSAIVDLIFERDIDKIQALIDSGEFKVNDFVSLDRSALALAASCDYTDVMEVLIKNGADVNLNDEGDLGYTPIESAARDGKLEAIKLLLKHHAEIDKGNTINTNALTGACIGAHKKALELLLKHGSDINHADKDGQTALHYLCRYAKQWGSYTISQTVDGVTTELENPRFKQHTEIFKVLLKNGADVNKETNYGYTSLHLCAETDTADFIAPLVAKGAQVNAVNSKGFSPLHGAADSGCLASAKALIKAGADVNAIDNDGFTPLLGAVASGNIELVKLLLKHGAVKNIKSKTGYGKVEAGDDAISLAERLENEEMIAALKK